MHPPKKIESTQRKLSAISPGRPVTAIILKGVAGLTAVLSLIFALNQLVDIVSGSREHHRQVEELLRTGKTQEEAGDFGAAWKSLEDAERLAKDGRETEAAHANLAMHWLETRLGPDQERFGDSLEKIVPFLDRAIAGADGQRKADLLAHRGWAQFLRADNKSGVSGSGPQWYFHQTLQIDPQNVYAHAMQGYRELWSVSGPRNGSGEISLKLAEARQEFSQALRAGREHEYARWLQLAGLEGLHHPDADVEFVRLVNEMRKNREQISRQTFNETVRFYSSRLSPWIAEGSDTKPTIVVHSAKRRPLLAALPTADQLATFSWIFDRADFNPSKGYLREYYRAVLQEAGGQRTEALQSLRAAQSKVPGDESEFLLVIEEAIRRLSKNAQAASGP